LLTTGICLSAQSAISLVLSLLFWGFFIWQLYTLWNSKGCFVILYKNI
jgi:hypothetical protein